MSKREKFYFIKQSDPTKEKYYLLIYRFLEKNPMARKDEIKTHLKKGKIADRLEVEINTLYKKILKSLHIFRLNSKSPELEILRNLNYIYILIEKGEVDMAKKITKKARKIAYHHEDYLSLNKIINIQERFYYNSIDSDITKKIKAFNDERNFLLEEMQRINKLKLLKLSLINLLYKEGLYIHDRSKLKYLERNELFQLEDYPYSKRGAKAFNTCKAMYLGLTGEYQKAKIYNLKNVELAFQYEHLFSAENKVRVYNNYLFNLILASEIDEFNVTYEKFKQLKTNSFSTSLSLIYVENYLPLLLNLKICHLENIEKYLNQTKIVLDSKVKEFNETQRDFLFFYVICGLLVLKRHESALDYILKWDRYQIEPFILIRRKILRIICFYELKKIRLLKSEVISFIKAITAKKQNNEVYDIFIDYMRRFIKQPSRKNEMEKELPNLFLTPSEKDELKKYFLEFYFDSWANSKMK